MELNIGWYLVLFMVSLGAAAFFCSAETAFISLQRLRVEHLVRTSGRKAARVARLMDQPEKFLATVLLAINFFESAIAALGTVMAVSFLGTNLGAAIATLGVTVVTLVIAEYIPKTLAARFGEKLVLRYAPIMELTMVALSPFVFVLSRIGMRFTGMAQEAQPRPTLSEEEFRTAITVGEEEGVLEEAQAEMIHQVFEFGDRPVREVMTPRTEISFVEKGTKLKEFVAQYPASPHTRFPVFEDNPDNVVGILSIKDVLIAQSESDEAMEAPVDRLIRPVLFVPETLRMGDLLAQMQRERQQLAVVVDEFGGMSGIVTLEQMVEEIVGGIGDELAGADREFQAVGENAFLVEGSYRIEDANEQMGLGLPEGDYQTVAGFILYHLGHIPKEGEQLVYDGLKMVVSEMKGKKIERVLFTRETPAQQTAVKAAS